MHLARPNEHYVLFSTLCTTFITFNKTAKCSRILVPRHSNRFWNIWGGLPKSRIRIGREIQRSDVHCCISILFDAPLTCKNRNENRFFEISPCWLLNKGCLKRNEIKMVGNVRFARPFSGKYLKPLCNNDRMQQSWVTMFFS